MKPMEEKQRKAMFANAGKNKFSFAPADISAMGVDAVGTAGSTVVAAVPLLGGLGAMYVGTDMILKTKERLGKQYEEEVSGKHKKSYSQRLLEKEKTGTKRNRFSCRASDDLSYYEWPDYGIQD
jgi:hypothetical protein